MKFKAPKGMRDFFPPEMALRSWIVDCWHRVSVRNGFEQYDGPILEELDLYRVKSGDEIVSQLFHLTDRAGRELAIRPEMTPTLARMVAARAATLKRPIKWYSVPRLCRAERPQRGRLREFFQWNIDILGEEGPLADAECIFVAIDFFRELGLTPEHVVVRINSRAVLASILRIGGFAPEQVDDVYVALDKRDKLSDEAFAEIIDKLGVADRQRGMLLKLGEARGPEGVEMVRELIGDDPEGGQRLAELEEVLMLLEAMGVGDYCRFDMGIVRGLAYYTGPVFEAFGRGGLQRAICGGGRYDRLLDDVGGPAMSAVGFGSSDVVIQDLLEEFGLLPDLRPRFDVFIADADTSDPAVFHRVLHLAGLLREQGISTVYSYRRQNLGKQLKQANEKGVRHVVIVDAQTLGGDQVAVKDMSAGTQEMLSQDELLRKLVAG